MPHLEMVGQALVCEDVHKDKALRLEPGRNVA